MPKAQRQALYSAAAWLAVSDRGVRCVQEAFGRWPRTASQAMHACLCAMWRHTGHRMRIWNPEARKLPSVSGHGRDAVRRWSICAQSPRIILDSKRRSSPHASAGSLQAGRWDEVMLGFDRHIPTPSFCACGNRGTSALGHRPGRETPQTFVSPARRHGQVAPCLRNTPSIVHS